MELNQEVMFEVRIYQYFNTFEVEFDHKLVTF